MSDSTDDTDAPRSRRQPKAAKGLRAPGTARTGEPPVSAVIAPPPLPPGMTETTQPSPVKSARLPRPPKGTRAAEANMPPSRDLPDSSTTPDAATLVPPPSVPARAQPPDLGSLPNKVQVSPPPFAPPPSRQPGSPPPVAPASAVTHTASPPSAPRAAARPLPPERTIVPRASERPAPAPSSGAARPTGAERSDFLRMSQPLRARSVPDPAPEAAGAAQPKASAPGASPSTAPSMAAPAPSHGIASAHGGPVPVLAPHGETSRRVSPGADQPKAASAGAAPAERQPSAGAPESARPAKAAKAAPEPKPSEGARGTTAPTTHPVPVQRPPLPAGVRASKPERWQSRGRVRDRMRLASRLAKRRFSKLRGGGPPRRPQFRRPPVRLAPVAAIGGSLVAAAVAYLGYDLTKGELAPCDAIFQETSLGLSTRVSFLQTEGELRIGREQLTELTERAQMAALNLKTCCTVLDAGRLDAEQFLQCKGSVRSYEARLDGIAGLVRQAAMQPAVSSTPAGASITTGSAAEGKADGAPAATELRPGIIERIAAEVGAAKEISRTFNERIVALREDQALQTLRATPPRSVTIEAQESEPNDDSLSTNQLALEAWITAAIDGGKDADYFTFTTPPIYRDIMRVELQNRSPTLEPRLELYDARRASIGSVNQTTPGADLSYTFVAEPGTSYSVRASNYYGESGGLYLLRVAPTEAYDAHEPNDDILSAKAIAAGTPVEAGIMDKADEDYFSVRAGDTESVLRVAIENRSTTLQPEVVVYDTAKAQIGSARNTTAGGDVSYGFRAQAKALYYVRVRDYYRNAAGDYTLTVSAAPPGDG